MWNLHQVTIPIHIQKSIGVHLFAGLFFLSVCVVAVAIMVESIIEVIIIITNNKIRSIMTNQLDMHRYSLLIIQVNLLMVKVDMEDNSNMDSSQEHMANNLLAMVNNNLVPMANNNHLLTMASNHLPMANNLVPNNQEQHMVNNNQDSMAANNHQDKILKVAVLIFKANNILILFLQQ